MSSTPAPDRFLTIQESARIIGGFCWLERHAFEVLGAWSAAEPHDEAALAFAEASLRHGWHSELWTERLPSARGLDVGELVAAPSVRALDVVGVLQALGNSPAEDAATATAARLGAWYGLVLPALIEAYGGLLDEVSPVAESPMRRALALALDDDRRELDAGRALLVAVGRPDPSDVASSVPPLDGGSWFVAAPTDIA